MEKRKLKRRKNFELTVTPNKWDYGGLAIDVLQIIALLYYTHLAVWTNIESKDGSIVDYFLSMAMVTTLYIALRWVLIGAFWLSRAACIAYAIYELFRMVENKPTLSPDFTYFGELVGIAVISFICLYYRKGAFNVINWQWFPDDRDLFFTEIDIDNK